MLSNDMSSSLFHGHIKHKSRQREPLRGVSVAAETRSLHEVGERALRDGLILLGLVLKVTLGTLGGLVPVGSRVAEALADGNGWIIVLVFDTCETR